MSRAAEDHAEDPGNAMRFDLPDNNKLTHEMIAQQKSVPLPDWLRALSATEPEPS